MRELFEIKYNNNIEFLLLLLLLLTWLQRISFGCTFRPKAFHMIRDVQKGMGMSDNMTKCHDKGWWHPYHLTLRSHLSLLHAPVLSALSIGEKGEEPKMNLSRQKQEADGKIMKLFTAGCQEWQLAASGAGCRGQCRGAGTLSLSNWTEKIFLVVSSWRHINNSEWPGGKRRSTTIDSET